MFFSQRREFKRLICNNRERLYRMAYAWTHDPYLADDLVQQAICKALSNQKQLKDMSAAQSWLFRILANCLADYHRVKREFVSDHNLIEVEQKTPEWLTGEQELVKSVRNGVGQLPLPQRQVVTLVDLEGFAYTMVSEILEIPVGTVMSRLCRGRKALRTILVDIKPQLNNEISIKLKSVK
jgi:RNA polymerase sigma-70 factor (ECF subfamily)